MKNKETIKLILLIVLILIAGSIALKQAGDAEKTRNKKFDNCLNSYDRVEEYETFMINCMNK